MRPPQSADRNLQTTPTSSITHLDSSPETWAEIKKGDVIYKEDLTAYIVLGAAPKDGRIRFDLCQIEGQPPAEELHTHAVIRTLSFTRRPGDDPYHGNDGDREFEKGYGVIQRHVYSDENFRRIEPVLKSSAPARPASAAPLPLPAAVQGNSGVLAA